MYSERDVEMSTKHVRMPYRIYRALTEYKYKSESKTYGEAIKKLLENARIENKVTIVDSILQNGFSAQNNLSHLITRKTNQLRRANLQSER